MKMVNWTKEQEHIVSNWIKILFTLNSFQPIRGRLRIIKELFLIAMEVSSELKDAIYFYPYNYGPYSSRAALKMNKFRKSGVITVKYAGIDWEYRLSESFHEEGLQLVKQLDPKTIKRVSEIKKRYHKYNSIEIIKDIYQRYPDYAIQSAVRKEIISTSVVDPDSVDPTVEESNLVVSLLPPLDYNSDTADENIQYRHIPKEMFT